MPIRKLMLLVVSCALLGIGGSIATVKTLGLARPEQPIVSVEDKPLEKLEKPVTTEIEREPRLTVTERTKEVTNPAFPVEGVTVTGWARKGKKVLVRLSDGTWLSERHPGLEEIVWESYIVVSGRRIPIKPTVPQSVKSTLPESSGRDSLGSTESTTALAPQSVTAALSTRGTPASEDGARENVTFAPL